MCVYYRKMNARTDMDALPLLGEDDVWLMLSKAKYFGS